MARLLLRAVPVILRRRALRRVLYSFLRRFPRTEARLRGILARDVSWVTDRRGPAYRVSDLSGREREIYVRLKAGIERRAGG
jgi:hypothetical protein